MIPERGRPLTRVRRLAIDSPKMDEVSADRHEDPLARALPDSVDAELVRSRLMASMFGRGLATPRFGRFELRERIGHGGMGVVYRAHDPQLERTVAIKLIDTRGFAASQRERALREARSLARLAHPNVITVFEAGLTDERVWIAMEYVPGATMHDYLSRTPRPDPTAILRHWIAVGRGLVAVHAAGLVHRDVKPSNVLIGDDGRARLIDFGLVHAPQVDPTVAGATRESGANDPPRPGPDFIGTRAYAAPEQLQGGEVDAAADQYSLCVSIWESLTERRPATDEGTTTIAGISPRIPQALARGLARAPADRFASLAALISELEAGVDGPRRRLGLIVGAAAVGALMAGAATSQLRDAPEPPPPCAADADALADTWDEARRDALRERLRGGGPEFAATTHATLERGLDDWADAWRAARTAACAATRIAGVQSDAALDLRNACLERRRRAVQVTLDTVLAADELELAARAPELLASLPRLADCDDPERLAQISPLPADGPARAAVLRGHDALARARALAAAGALARAQAGVDEFVASDGEALRHTPLRLELEAFPAQLELQRERAASGVPTLVRVAREAGARRLDDLAASLLIEAADAAAGHWSKPELEQSLVDEAASALQRLDRPSDGRTVSLRAARADLLAQAGRFADALALYEQARALALALRDLDRAAAQDLHVAAMLEELGRFDDARATLAEGQAAARQRWGADAPMVGKYEFDLALLALTTGDFVQADARLERTEAIFRAAFGPDALTVAAVWFARVKLDMVAGEFVRATTRLDAALVVYARELGPDHELLAELHEARGVLGFFAGQQLAAIASYEAALRIRADVSGPEHPGAARLHSNIGESQLALGQLDAARSSFARSLSILTRTLPADHPDLALPFKGRGQAALAAGQPAEAIADLERALGLLLTSGGEPLELADVRFSLARALRAGGERPPTRARTLAREARADFASVHMDDRVATIDAWLRE